MRRVRLSMAMSLDGYIAGPNGEYDWIVTDPDMDFAELMSGFDTVLIGRKTYDAMGRQGGGMPGMKAFVFSSTLRQDECKGVTVSSDPKTTVAELKSKPGKDIWLFGGGELFRSMLDMRLVDSIELAVIPVLLGGGRSLLPPPVASNRLKLISHRLYPKSGTLVLKYEPTT